MTTEADEAYAGIFGFNAGTITNLGAVNGTVTLTVNSVDAGKSQNFLEGGLVAKNTGTITGCYNTNNVTLDVTENNKWVNVYSGGISGDCTGTISDYYNVGQIYTHSNTGHAGAGGITGHGGTITTCYNAGLVTLEDGTSADAMSIGNALKIENCYTLPVGLSGNSEIDYVPCLEEGQMLTAKTFQGFDFYSTWTYASEILRNRTEEAY